MEFTLDNNGRKPIYVITSGLKRLGHIELMGLRFVHIVGLSIHITKEEQKLIQNKLDSFNRVYEFVPRKKLVDDDTKKG